MHNEIKASPSPAERICRQEAGLERLVQLDGLRALAFLAVFLYHSLGIQLLWVGVDLFFVLSGFLITGILLRASKSSSYFTTFYYRRCLRIFPPYYTTLLVVFVFLDPGRARHAFWYVFYLSNIRDSFGAGAGVHMLDPMWSLALEEQFYILWPLLVYYLGQKGLWRLTIALVLATPAVRAILTVYSHDCRPVIYLLIARADLLAAGAILALLWQRSPTLFRRLSALSPFLSLSSLMVFGFLAIRFGDFRTSANSVLFNSLGYSLIGAIMVGVVAYFIPHRDNVLGRFLSSRVMVYLGTISYTMYLIHEVILKLVEHLRLPALLNSGTALAVVLLWSTLSWHTMEKPLQALKNKRRYVTARG